MREGTKLIENDKRISFNKLDKPDFQENKETKAKTKEEKIQEIK